MEQPPWARKVPPKPPSDLGRSSDSPNAPSGPRSPLQTSSPPGRPAGNPRELFGTVNSPRDIKKRKRLPAAVTSRRLVAAMVSGLLVCGVGFIVYSRQSQSSQQNSTDQNPVSQVDSDTSLPSSNVSILPPIGSEGGNANWDALARSVVFIEALSPCDWRGSGTLVLDGSYVLTNEHVASDGHCELVVGLTDGLSSKPSGNLNAIVVARDADIDLAVLRLVDSAGNPVIPPGHSPVSINYDQPSLGSRLTTLGYPALGAYEAGMTITFTSGDFSGIENSSGEFYKTTAQMRGGISGGAAFNEQGLFIGVPTAGLIDEAGEDVGINLIRPAKYAKPLLEQAKSNPLDPVVISSTGSNSDEADLEQSQSDPRFGTCKEAKSNGYGPYYIGVDQEYNWYRDADSDGVVCE